MFYTIPRIFAVEDPEFIVCNCLFCYAEIKLFLKGNSCALNTTGLEKHLDTVHFGLYSQIRRLHPTVQSLFADEQVCIEKFVGKSSRSGEGKLTVIQHYAHRASKNALPIDEDKDEERDDQPIDLSLDLADDKDEDNAGSSPSPSHPTTYKPSLSREEKNRFLKIARAIAFGIPIAWNTNDDVGIQTSLGNDIFPSYYEFRQYAPKLVDILTEARRQSLRGMNSYAFACDGWSTQRHAISLEALFVNSFHRNSFKSILLDVIPIESSTSDSIANTVRSTCSKFNLNPDKPITTDGATNNLSALSNRRSICWAHSFSTVISHIMNGTNLKQRFPKLGLLQGHFKKVNAVCNQVKSKKKEFAGWVRRMHPSMSILPILKRFAFRRTLQQRVGCRAVFRCSGCRSTVCCLTDFSGKVRI